MAYWASDVGYLYYTASMTVGVADAEGPLGPFTVRRKLFDNAIEAHLFRDDDGRLSLYLVQLPGFRITFAELQDLCRDRPEELATILLAGYVSLGERLGDTDPEQARWYRSAARVLEKLCGREPRTAPEPASPAPPVTFEESAGPIRRLTRFLGRVFGLQDEEAWD